MVTLSMEFTKDLNVGALLLLEPRPCGRLLFKDEDDLFSENDREIVTQFFCDSNHHKKYREYPLVAYMNYFERPEHFGCLMGGMSQLYINSNGDVQPCVYLPVTFGNIMKEDFLAIYNKMRKVIPTPLNIRCPSFYIAKIIKEKKIQRSRLPVPFMDIRREWDFLLSINQTTNS